ncbi:hypothetical protein NDU88_005060 [Pleurodeles waltl]|uniref:Uncharacterized protein n=1 Tax=Pleurodeles waltl TaxID=8319 RepID=A0AAV7UH29_PLEWA|nr:hypothetical protein NDU88_005060 [Pleurodeles waltl]
MAFAPFFAAPAASSRPPWAFAGSTLEFLVTQAGAVRHGWKGVWNSRKYSARFGSLVGERGICPSPMEMEEPHCLPAACRAHADEDQRSHQGAGESCGRTTMNQPPARHMEAGSRDWLHLQLATHSLPRHVAAHLMAHFASASPQRRSVKACKQQ